jgi:hypothetical protein
LASSPAPEYRHRQEKSAALVRAAILTSMQRKLELVECVSGAEVPDMNVSFA